MGCHPRSITLLQSLALYWLVTVPFEQRLQRCGPAVSARRTGATCWSGHTFVRVDGETVAIGIGPQKGTQGPQMYDLELERAARFAEREGWWRIWSLLQDPFVLPRVAFALAAYDLETGAGAEASGITGCTDFTGNYQQEGSVIALEGLNAAPCDAADREAKQREFLQVLSAVSIANVVASRLWLETADGGRLVFTEMP